jgi:hypothetical protein
MEGLTICGNDFFCIVKHDKNES